MKLNTIMVAAFAAAFAGCVETAGTRVSIDTRSGDASVLEASTRLANRVRIVGVSYDDVLGIKKATVTIESLSHKRQELQARMVWMDADGAEVDADSKPFRAIVLDGMDITTFTGMAPSPRCVKARLQLRETDTAQ